MTECLFECLREARLEQYYPKLEARGITVAEKLSQLTMNDYSVLGINSLDDKKRLFRLIQIIKAVQGQPPKSAGQGQPPRSAGQGQPLRSAGLGQSIKSVGQPQRLASQVQAVRPLSQSQSARSTTVQIQGRPPRSSVAQSQDEGQLLKSSSQAQGLPQCSSQNLGPKSVTGLDHNEKPPSQSQSVRVETLYSGRPEVKGTESSANAKESSQSKQESSSESDKENVRVPREGKKSVLQAKLHGAGTLEKKRSASKKSVEYPAKCDVSEASLKGLKVVVPDTAAKPDEPAFVERITHNTGYNYGLPNSASKPKAVSIPSSQSPHSEADETKIKVCVRKRPMNKREKKKDPDVIRIEGKQTVVLIEPKVAVDLTKFTQEHAFMFDEVFGENMINKEVYERTAKHLIECVFNGGMATCFVYGQTGAGKTHTIMGNVATPGLYLLAAQDIFNSIKRDDNSDVLVWMSYFEIYCGQLFDLLNKRKRLQVREDASQRVNIAGLSEVELDNVQTLMEAVEHGNKVRSTGASGVNPDSSRSHAVLQIELRNNNKQRIGKISFIDLAGSERAADVTDTDRQNRLEGAEINQSLLALKECIRALDQESRHTPFRQSKLTHILKDSFIGNCKTCMIANISPCQSASENTLNTLRYADRVKELRKDLASKPKPTEEIPMSVKKPAILKEFPSIAGVGQLTPSVFHPSTIPLSSTPMRPQKDEKSTTETVGYNQFESPICGHKIRPRKLAAVLAAEVQPMDKPVKERPRKSKGASDQSDEAGLNTSILSNMSVSSSSVKPTSVPGGQKKEKDTARNTDVDSCSEKPMDVSLANLNVSSESKMSTTSQRSQRGGREPEKCSNLPNECATKRGTKYLPTKLGKESQCKDSPLNLSIMKHGKFDKQTNLIARLEKAMEKTREALNRSLTSHDLIPSSDIENDDVLLRGDEAPPMAEKQVTTHREKKESLMSKPHENQKQDASVTSPVVLEKFKEPTIFNNSVKSFSQLAKNSPVTKEKIRRLVRNQKEAAGKIRSLKKIPRTPPKMAEELTSAPTVKEEEDRKTHDRSLETAQEVSPSKRRRLVATPEDKSEFETYLTKALNDTGNKRNKYQVYDGKFLPKLNRSADKNAIPADEKPQDMRKNMDLNNGADVNALPGGEKLKNDIEKSNEKKDDEVDSKLAEKDLNTSSESQTRSPNVVRRSLLSDFKETSTASERSPVTKSFLSPRNREELQARTRVDLMKTLSTINKITGENGSAKISDLPKPFSCASVISQDTDVTEKNKTDLKGSDKSPDMRRPKLMDKDTGGLYTMSNSPQKSPRTKNSPRAHNEVKLIHGEITTRSDSLPTPDEFLKSLAGKRLSAKKSKERKRDEPRSECLERPKVAPDVEPRSESGVVRKERAKWQKPREEVAPRSTNLLIQKPRPTWLKPTPTKRTSLVGLLDDPSALEKEEPDSKSELMHDFYSKFLKYSTRDKMFKENFPNMNLGAKSVRDTVSDSAIVRKREPSGSKSDTDVQTDLTERAPFVSRTVTDSGIVIPRLNLDKKQATSATKDDDIETASVSTLDDVSSIASVRSLPVKETAVNDPKTTFSKAKPPVDLQKTACSAWKKTAVVKPKCVKPQPKPAESPKKGSKVTKKVTCTAPLRSDKLKSDPLATFLPIHPYPVTPRSNDVLTAPKVITKIVVEEDSKDKSNISDNLDDSEIVRSLKNAENNLSSAKKDDLVNSLSTISKALKQGKLNVGKDLSKSSRVSHSDPNNSVEPLSKTLGYSSKPSFSSVVPRELPGSPRKGGRDSYQRQSNVRNEEDVLRNTISASTGQYLKNELSRAYKLKCSDLKNSEPGHRSRLHIDGTLEHNMEARKDLGQSLRNTYDNATLRTRLASIASGSRNTHRGSNAGYKSLQSMLDGPNNLEVGSLPMDQVKLKVISGHEEHLADVTAMCRKEMTLLKQVRAGEMSFSDYTNKMADMLLMKLKSIEILRDRIAHCKIVS